MIHTVAGDLSSAGRGNKEAKVEYGMAAKILLEISDLYGSPAPRAQKVVREGVQFKGGLDSAMPTRVYRVPSVDWKS